MIFFKDTATTEIYTLSLHDALPIWSLRPRVRRRDEVVNVQVAPVVKVGENLHPGHGGQLPIVPDGEHTVAVGHHLREDRKSTRLNSSHANISYAVFCLQKTTHKHHI